MTVTATLLSSYFNRDDELEEFLKNYNDEFPEESDIKDRLEAVFPEIERVFENRKSRAWSEVNLLPLIVEIDRALRSQKFTPEAIDRLNRFFERIGSDGADAPSDTVLGKYYRAQRYATADRSSRRTRGRLLQKVINGCAERDWLVPEPTADEGTTP